MISTLKCYIQFWRYKRYFRDVARNITPNAIDHLRQLNVTVGQVDQMVAEATEQAENAGRLYEETRKEFAKQDVSYPDAVITRKLDGVEYKYSYQLKKLHRLEKMHNTLVGYRNQTESILGLRVK